MRRKPDLRFAGCAGPQMAAAGVDSVCDQKALQVVGLAEVVSHLPAIYRQYRRLIQWADRERPAAAILTDSSGFHLRVARRLKDLGIPVAYLVAPQAWAWRQGRVRKLRRNVERLLCIFPFEEKFFRSYGIRAHYIGHPLARLIRVSTDRRTFFDAHQLVPGKPLIALLPGSRPGEIARHLPILRDATKLISGQFLLGAPAGLDTGFIEKAMAGVPVKVASGSTWDLLGHCDVALAASGTVTVEAALLGAPMVTFYRVSELTWRIGRPLVKAPFLSMVNLIAEKKIVPELIQGEATGEKLAAEARLLLHDMSARDSMRLDLRTVAKRLATAADPIETAADHLMELMNVDV